MTLMVLVLVAVLATLCRVLGWRRTSVVLYTLTLVALLAVGSGLASRSLLRNLQTGYATEVTQWGTHNDIILLGAGSTLTDRGVESSPLGYSRLAKAFELYRDCKAHVVECHIISSGGDVGHYGKSEAELFKASLLKFGAAEADLITEGRSLNTWQNAQFTAEILQKHSGGSIVLVTSGLHLKRSELYFAHFGVQGQNVRGDYAMGPVLWMPNAYSFWLTDLALHEYLGLARYHVYNALGWNVKASKAGSV